MISGLVVALLVAMTLYIESVHAQLRAVKETIGHVSPVRITCCQPFSTRRYFGLGINQYFVCMPMRVAFQLSLRLFLQTFTIGQFTGR